MDYYSVDHLALCIKYNQEKLDSEYLNMVKVVETNTSIHSYTISVQILERVRLYARRRISWLRKVWTEAGAQKGNRNGVHLEIDGYLNNADIPASEINWFKSEESIQSLNQAIYDIEQVIDKDSGSRINQLIRTFNLKAPEIDLLHTCFASALEPGLNSVNAYLNDHSGRGYVTESMTARLFGHGYCLPIGPESPLKIWGLVTEHDAGRGEPNRFELSPFIRNWLLGMDVLDEMLTSFAHWQPVHTQLNNWPVKEVTEWIRKMLKLRSKKGIRIYIAGAEGSGKRSFAASVANKLRMPLLSLNSDRMIDSNWTSGYMRAQRQALLNNCALVWSGNMVKVNTWPEHIPSCPIQFITGEVDEYLQQEDRFLDYTIELPALQTDQRKDLWLKLIPAATSWSKEELNTIVRRRQTNIGQINAVAALHITSSIKAAEVIGFHARRRLGSLAHIVSNDFNKLDLVLPNTLLRSLDDFIFEATERVSLWEQTETKRLFPQGQGLLALFTGPPGTGKTMAAQVIANELQLDLYRVDMSAMVSKYVGETSKNIERILSRAQRMDVMLLFDEADALFGKRTDINDGQDRFANTDTNYLLQAIEQYPGIAILASNRKSNIDNGFMRRLRYILEFPKPDAQLRLQIWQRILRELGGSGIVEHLNKELTQIAVIQELTGAQIKYVILTAVYLARKEGAEIRLVHLMRGLEQELMKEGRGVDRQISALLKK